MPQGIKISLAGIVTWIAAISSYNAIFSWADWPLADWLWYETPDHSFEDFVSLCIFPPLVVVLGFLLFSWALDEKFVSLVARKKSKIVPVIFFFLLLSAASNSYTAAGMASDAYDAAKDAASKCQ